MFYLAIQPVEIPIDKELPNREKPGSPKAEDAVEAETRRLGIQWLRVLGAVIGAVFVIGKIAAFAG